MHLRKSAKGGGRGRPLQQYTSIENSLNSSPDGSCSSSTSSLVVACSSSTSAPVVAVASSSSVVARDASGNAPTTALTMAGISSVVSGRVFCRLFCRSLLVWLAFLLGGGAVEAVVVLWGCSLESLEISCQMWHSRLPSFFVVLSWSSTGQPFETSFAST